MFLVIQFITEAHFKHYRISYKTAISRLNQVSKHGYKQASQFNSFLEEVDILLQSKFFQSIKQFRINREHYRYLCDEVKN